MNKLLLVYLFLFSSSLAACFPAKISLENRLLNTTNISVGIVTGKTLTGFEETLTQINLPIQTNQRYELRVKITENLKGRFHNDVILPKISTCGSGSAELKDKIVLFFVDDNWFVTLHSKEIYEEIVTLLKAK